MNFRTLATCCCMTLSLLLCSTSAMAQPDDRYVLSVESATAGQGDQITIAVTLDSVNGTLGAPEPISGWSYGVCHDPAVATVVDVVDGVTSATVFNGNPPAFNSINPMPVPGDGFAIGVVIDLFNMSTLPAGTGYELNVATYDLSATPGTTSLDFCDTLATPAVQTLIVYGTGSSAVPVQNSGSITVTPGTFHFSCPPTSALPGDSVSIPVNLENSSDVQGFSFGFTYDASFMGLTDIQLGAAVAATNMGMGPGFASVNLTPGLPGGATGGGTYGIVISLQPPFDFIPAGSANEVAIFDFDIAPAATGSSDICFSDQVGTPTVDLVVTVAGATQDPTFDCCTVDVGGMPGPDFIRGDANDDGVVDISDGLFIAWWFFGLGPAGTCEDAADANGNGSLDTMDDPLTVLNFLFVAGPPPAAPFPLCGAAASLLGCANYSSCP